MLDIPLRFSIPEVCLTDFQAEDDDYDNGTNPIILVCEKADQCDFINSHIITWGTIFSRLNIDKQDVLGLILEVRNQLGFMITQAEWEMIKRISLIDDLPIIPRDRLLTRIIISADVGLNPALSKALMDSRKAAGFFNITFGYRPDEDDTVYTGTPAVFIKIKHFSTIPSQEFSQSIIPPLDSISYN